MANTTVEKMKQPNAIHSDLFLLNDDLNTFHHGALSFGEGAKMMGKPGIFFLPRGPSPVTSDALNTMAVAAMMASGSFGLYPRQTHERKVIYFFIRPGRG
ncbi:hypothetical protein AGMMS49940_19720 [Spirochaetia bacterium]|nr:hypothetical protein AGMMS49940_19720 [Spirochaetia bacterium]